MKTKIILLSVLTIFACSESKFEQDVRPEEIGYVKLKFINIDQTFEESEIHLVKDRKNGNKTLEQPLKVDSDITIYEGTYSVVEIENNAKITIAGPEVVFKNINPKNKSDVFITILKNASLGISSSLNMNGAYTISNYGTLVSSNVEMQNGKNKFYNYGLHSIVGDLQILSETSTYSNCGTLRVSNHTQLNGGRLDFCNCGTLETYGLNVNRENTVSGNGFITVLGNLNVNKKLSASKSILFCYDEEKLRKLNKNEIENLEGVTRTCVNTCIPDPLPIKYSNLVVSRTSNNVKINFNIIESYSLQGMEVYYSKDAKSWSKIYTEKPDKLKANTKYSNEIPILKP